MAEEKLMSKEMEEYFKQLDKDVQKSYDVAKEARKKGFDPETKVDIPLAKNMAERVEGLISDVAPQIVGSGITRRIIQLEKEYGVLDWRVGFIIAEEVAKEKFCKFKDKKEAIEVGIRVGFAYLTVGIVSAPLEGFVELRIKKRLDGQEYFSIFYSGPIRGAGGTAAATSVILADYVRVKLGYHPYDPTEDEVNRYVTEVLDYHERVTNLQYFPTEDELKFMVRHVPVEINGDPTESFEVSQHKDLPRVETNRIRGGICLVLAEGLCQKSPKIWKRLAKWGKEIGLDWEFLKDFLDLQKKKKAKTEEGSKEEKKEKITPNYVFINDLVAGRPVLTHPLSHGGFRLRYGRTRISGFSAASIHPATMHLLNKYIATGTQLKVERPGKAAAITLCDSIEGPIVKLDDGSVLRIYGEGQSKELAERVKEILFLGDFLFNYGDFSENGHMLVPPGYCEEWWVQELEKATVDMFGNLDLDKLAELLQISAEWLDRLLKEPTKAKVDGNVAVNITERLNIPLHPKYSYHWNCISTEQLSKLFKWVSKANVRVEENTIQKIIIPYREEEKRILELIGAPHLCVNKEFVVLEKDDAIAIAYSFSLQDELKPKDLEKYIGENKDKKAVDILNSFFNVRIRDKSGTFIGARMGRPEKAKMRKLTGSPHILFPVGDQGGRLRCFQAALDASKIKGDFPIYRCSKCDKDTIYPICEECGRPAKRIYYCKVCGGIEKEECTKHGKAQLYKAQEIDIRYYFNKAMKVVGDRTAPDLIKGVRGTSNKDHTPENLVKGLLRAKHDIYVNKDGTTRYDMSELPITHFKPKEVRVSIEKLKELGYTKDIKGEEIKDGDQVIELKAQDVILPSSPETLDEPADDVLFRVANFIDEMLVKLYGQKPFYNLKVKEDLIGHLVIGLAPHISAGMVGRIVGFSETQGCYAHPMWHAGLRRDCDGDECCVILLMDALINFSRQFLPDKRGSRTMDSPLVLTSKLIPSEVDDQVLGIDVVKRYPLEFYNAALEYKYPWSVSVEQLKDRLYTERQYEKFGFTHDISNINAGVMCSAYKSLPSMEEKLKGQMDLAVRLRAVDESDVARLVIEKHFLKDTKGNLRKFSMQQFRCVNCNEKYRRPPLVGKCTKCKGGKIIFTISEGSVVKYMEPSISLAEKYNVPAYLKQTLELTKRRIEDNFGKEKEKQEGLGKWFG